MADVTSADPGPDASGDRLTHLDDSGAAHMVDVGAKPTTRRRAVAGARFQTTPRVIELVSAAALPKGDVLATARIAGIMAAKRTDSLIPLCHQLSLSSVEIDFAIGEAYIDITATATTAGPTGVEMEALTAAAVTGLTLHDMVKAVDRLAHLDDLRLLAKSGGRSGDWVREQELDAPEN